MNDLIVRPSAQPKPRHRCRLRDTATRAMGERKRSVNRLVPAARVRWRPLPLEDSSPALSAGLGRKFGAAEKSLSRGWSRRAFLQDSVAAGAVIAERVSAGGAPGFLERTDAGVGTVGRKRPAAILALCFHCKRKAAMSGLRRCLAPLPGGLVSRKSAHLVQHFITPDLCRRLQGEERPASPHRDRLRSLAPPILML